jgi:queuosine precursor transporter
MNLNSRRDLVFLVLAGFFITNAILAELMGGKLVEIPLPLPFLDGFPVASLGVLPWPVVFITTDLVNEYFGKKGVRTLTFLTVALIIFAFIVLFLGLQIPAVGFSPVQDDAYNAVFGQSLWIIVGSIIAFMVSQFVDVRIFWAVRDRTGGKKLWARATGSTAVSQLIDTFLILGIAFLLPGKLTFPEYIKLSLTNYTYKFAIAVLITPLVYAAHAAIDEYLKEPSAS